MYKEWADGQINKMKGILNSARKDHTDAVQTRIESVKELGGVVDITKNLFQVSKVRHVVLWPTIYPCTLAYSPLGNRATGGESLRARAKDCSCSGS